VKIDSPRWLLGFNVDVVRGHEHAHGHATVEVVSHRPAYYEMIYHFVITYLSSRPNVDNAQADRDER
jgi:hypothetical protein